MKQVSHRGYLLIDAPGLASSAEVFYSIDSTAKILFTNDSGKRNINPLPPGQWEIIGKASEVTYQVEMDIVEFKKTFGYRKYDAVNGAYQWVSNANDSFVSLLKSHGMKPETTLILKLKNHE